jgi:cyanophycin synthetase
MDLVLEGTRSARPKNDPQVIFDEDEAVDHALAEAEPGSIICIFTARIEEMTAKIKTMKELEGNIGT